MAATELLASDVVIVEEEPRVTSLPITPTAVLGGVGVTERGPFGPTIANSFPEWVETYGGLTATADLTLAAMGYFLNGGSTMWGVRIVHVPDHSNPVRQSAAASATVTTTGAATQGEVESGNAEPFVIEPGGTLDLSVDGGGTETATFDADAAVVTGSGGSYPTGFAAAENIVVEIDDSGVNQQIDFTASQQTLAEVLQAINSQLNGGKAYDSGGEVAIESDLVGTDSKVLIVSGSANALTALGLSASQTDAGGGDVANASAVTAAEVKTVVEADTTAEVSVESGGTFKIKTPTVGASGSIQVEATSTLDGAGYFDLDNAVHAGQAAGPGNMATINAKSHGEYANTLSVVIADASSGDSDQFNLQVTEGGVVLESFPNLSTVLTDPRYFESYLNSSVTGSNLIEAVDLLTGSPPANRPDNGTYSLSGGDDGLTGLNDADFIGGTVGPTGLYELDQVENLTLLIVPNRATSAVHQAMLAYCETWREGQVFAILDPPSGMTAAQIVTYVKTTAAIKNYSEHGAIYWPRIKIVNPSETAYTSDADGNITVAPSGWLAGIYARTDAARPGGIYDPPAGVERGIIYGCVGFETDEVLDKRKRDLVYPELINPLTTWSGAPRHVDGTRTLKETGNFPTIAERRGVSYIARTIKLGLAFVRHSNNTKALRRRAHRTVYLFLLGEHGKGAFASEDPDQAFFVDFSDKLNTPTVIQSRTLKGRVGLATNKPVDWAVISISQDTRALDEQIAELQSGF